MRTRVLIADDQAEVRAALITLINSEPSLELVGSAEDADQAIELTQLHRPDVALLDVKMPGGGERATREIGSCSPETRVVAFSAYENRASVFQMLRAGAVGYLVKGARAEEILETIHRSAQGQGVLAAEVTGEVVHELAQHLDRQADREERRCEQVGRIRRVLRDNALTMAFQPIAELESRRVVGFEALARFTVEPQQAPSLWFAEAAAVGLQTDLELAAVCMALAHVEQLPEGTDLFVNVDPNTLISPSILKAFADARVERVVIEVTEHVQIDDYDALNEALLEVRARGGRLAIDDAGAGFASLRHILRLSPDIIKIDGSLIREIETDRAARALTSALVSFAAEMGQTVVAEGVESERLVEVLRALGVRNGQGYHLARPDGLPK